MRPPRKKKVDYAALNSVFMRIPRMNVLGARALLDLGFKEIYELRGRDPNSLLADLKKVRIEIPKEIIGYFEIAVAFAESE